MWNLALKWKHKKVIFPQWACKHDFLMQSLMLLCFKIGKPGFWIRWVWCVLLFAGFCRFSFFGRQLWTAAEWNEGGSMGPRQLLRLCYLGRHVWLGNPVLGQIEIRGCTKYTSTLKDVLALIPNPRSKHESQMQSRLFWVLLVNLNQPMLFVGAKILVYYNTHNQ